MTASSPARERRLLPNWAIGLLGLLALMLLMLGFVLAMGVAATSQWNTLAQGIRGRGQPITLAEIEARREAIPDEQNSALLLRSLVEGHGDVLSGVGAVEPDRSEGTGNVFLGVTQKWLDAARAYLDEHADKMLDLLPILRMPSGRFPLDWTTPAIQVMLPDLSYLREYSRIARLTALFAAIDRKQAAAADWIVVQFRLAGSLDGEPILISRLVQMAIERQAGVSLEECLAVSEFDDRQLSALADELDRRLRRAAIIPALLGERAVFVDTCECVLTGKLTARDVVNLDGQTTIWPTLARLPVWLVRKNQIMGTSIHTRMIDAGEDIAALRTAALAAEAEVMGLSNLYVVAKIMMPSLTRAITLHAKTIAALRTARAAVAAERFRLSEGRWPQNIEELIPGIEPSERLAQSDHRAIELPAAIVDPFDHQPLRLRFTEEGLIIYSIDENLLDDNGDVTPRPGTTKTLDLGFRLLNRENRELRIVEEADRQDDW